MASKVYQTEREQHVTGKLSVVVGGQFGSEGKGHLVAWLSKQSTPNGEPPIVVRVAGPNAGHSAVDDNGITWALRQVPVAAVSNPDARLFIAAGSEVDFDVLLHEILQLDDAGFHVSSRLTVDPNATWLTAAHRLKESEGSTAKHGSTGKGIGEARSDRALRKAFQVKDWYESEPSYPPFHMEPTAQILIEELRRGAHVIIEGTQGYGLGVHSEFYPFATSSDCRAIDFLAMAGISPWVVDKPDVWVVIRPYPIRIAGNSGPLKDETTWEELGLPSELTTVTRKTRRVGGWDAGLVRDAVRANGGNVKIAFCMADQVVPDVAGLDGGEFVFNPTSPLGQWVNRIENAVGDASQVLWIGTGPGTAIWREPRHTMPTITEISAKINLEVVNDVSEDNSLIAWWMDLAASDAQMAVKKAASYGSNSLAAMGRMLGSLCSDAPMPQEEALELGCFAYAYGKMERVLDSIQRGGLPGMDCWIDLRIYATMVARIRQEGNWPG